MTNKKYPEPTDPFPRRQLPLSLGRMCAGSQSTANVFCFDQYPLFLESEVPSILS